MMKRKVVNNGKGMKYKLMMMEEWRVRVEVKGR
jgi:hypothetical protein